MFAAQHADRLRGLVYLDGAGDPTLTPADVGSPMPDLATLPRPIRRERDWDFPEAVDQEQLNPVFRKASLSTEEEARFYAVRVPVLAIYQAHRPFEEWPPACDSQRPGASGLTPGYAATRALYTDGNRICATDVPTARTN